MDRNINRRKFIRVKAPLFYKPARFYVPRKPVVDIGMGGLRVYSDESLKTGQRLKISLYLPDNQKLSFYVKVVWISKIFKATAKFDIGLEFIEISKEALHKLSTVLENHAH
ncbi:PilZ domain-containing protein [candidate division KSB1 bacterium]|nr:PilZ domain-containing protein [candidate division KSB1 bacterium]